VLSREAVAELLAEAASESHKPPSYYKTPYALMLIAFFHFYARKQLLLSARLSHRNSVYLSVCLSVRLSHRWISQKRCKIGSPNLHCRLPGRL